MNKIFADHVTNTAFFLSMSKRQIAYLIHLNANAWGTPDYVNRPNVGPDTWYATYRSLEAKGMVVREISDPVRNYGYYKVTKAGQIMCQLLEEAGFVNIISGNVEKTA